MQTHAQAQQLFPTIFIAAIFNSKSVPEGSKVHFLVKRVSIITCSQLLGGITSYPLPQNHSQTTSLAN